LKGRGASHAQKEDSSTRSALNPSLTLFPFERPEIIFLKSTYQHTQLTSTAKLPTYRIQTPQEIAGLNDSLVRLGRSMTSLGNGNGRQRLYLDRGVGSTLHQLANNRAVKESK
jgi:hypothetical protein